MNNLYVLLDWKRCKETRNTNAYKSIVKKVVVCHHAKEHFPKGSIIYCLMMWSLWMWIMTFKLHTVSLLHVMWLIKYTSAIDNFFMLLCWTLIGWNWTTMVGASLKWVPSAYIPAHHNQEMTEALQLPQGLLVRRSPLCKKTQLWNKIKLVTTLAINMYW